MRITDHRYTRDLHRYHLALKLISFEARTHTICAWTGLSDERVRNLCHSYAKPEQSLKRHRGPSPNRPGIFLRTMRMRNEGAALGGLFKMLDVLPPTPMLNARKELPTLAQGERLCNAYALYRQIIPDTLVSIEYAVMLAIALAQASELLLSTCSGCDGAILVDRYGSLRRTCIYCQRLSTFAPLSVSAVEEDSTGSTDTP